jgi:L-cysteine desulfidase
MNMSTTLAGLGLGGVTTGAIIFAEVVLTGATQVNLKEAFGVGAVVVGLVWWMGKKFTRIEDSIENIENRLKSLPCDKKGCK